MEQLMLDVISGQVKEKRVIRSSQQKFTKGKSVWWPSVLSWTDEERVVRVLLDFSDF